MTPEGIRRFMDKELGPSDIEKHSFWKDGKRYFRSFRDPKGYWTIGWGSMLEDDGLTEERMKNIVITEEEAKIRLLKEIEVAEKDIRKYVPRFDQLNYARQEALIHFSFTLGGVRLKKFENGQTLYNINSEAWISAGESLKRTQWAKDVGRIRAEEVVHAIKYGFWPDDQRVF